ncbi:polysaccharide deacetylase family protein [Cyclobacterium plantarum]|uniref:Polysaccharide deacetylase family protein n=1 Tax=Cyclobacterium plantarum TaxID=2716263 RepID=A0ABX0H543_9BACT|nr:polysaccharide deacetylase family protein [Cyclobacterium plantarum]NHE55646.1 polysaccharide deacetylase family protein [Cyclobacterium plantarum]
MLRQIHLKIYYRFLELISLFRIKEDTSESSLKKCFIYFDYEREFSGHETNISNLDIEYLLDHLDQVKIKTTWFTVGKVIEKYPETLSKIAEKGHEVGSHTYAHVSPKVMDRSTMETDFTNFDSVKFNNKLNVEGFHSPNGQWNISMFNFLIKNKFIYDVIYLPYKGKKISPMKFTFFKQYPIVRLVTVGDDWPLYGAEKSRVEVFEYFKALYDKTKIGDTFGIGFHPWILYSSTEILLGYKDFLSYLTQQKDVIIKPALFFSNAIKNQLVEK